MKKSLYQLFQEPAPAGWIPKIGDQIVVPVGVANFRDVVRGETVRELEHQFVRTEFHGKLVLHAIRLCRPLPEDKREPPCAEGHGKDE